MKETSTVQLSILGVLKYKISPLKWEVRITVRTRLNMSFLLAQSVNNMHHS